MKFICMVFEIIIFVVFFSIAWGKTHWSVWAILLCLAVMAESHHLKKATRAIERRIDVLEGRTKKP